MAITQIFPTLFHKDEEELAQHLIIKFDNNYYEQGAYKAFFLQNNSSSLIGVFCLVNNYYDYASTQVPGVVAAINEIGKFKVMQSLRFYYNRSSIILHSNSIYHFVAHGKGTSYLSTNNSYYSYPWISLMLYDNNSNKVATLYSVVGSRLSGTVRLDLSPLMYSFDIIN